MGKGVNPGQTAPSETVRNRFTLSAYANIYGK